MPVIGAVGIAAVGVGLVAGYARWNDANAERVEEAREISRANGTETSTSFGKPPTKLTIERPADGPLRVVFAGDSLTYGLFASKESKGYRALVVSELEKGGDVEWSRGGQTGNTVKTVADTIDFPAGTDLIVLALGTNDLYKTKVPTFTQQYADLVNDAATSAPDAQILCLGVWGNADAARLYDTPIERACAREDGVFVGLDDLFVRDGLRGPSGRQVFGGKSDNFHPNDRGYAAIAERALDALVVS